MTPLWSLFILGRELDATNQYKDFGREKFKYFCLIDKGIRRLEFPSLKNRMKLDVL